MDKGKATITGMFTRINKDINNDFTRKSKDSVVSKDYEGQSKKEILIEQFMVEYIKKGDNLFNILKSNPF